MISTWEGLLPKFLTIIWYPMAGRDARRLTNLISEKVDIRVTKITMVSYHGSRVCRLPPFTDVPAHLPG